MTAATTRRAPPRSTPGWVVVAAGAAPVALIGGGLAATALQPSPATAAWATISDLAARYAHHSQIMTAALAVTGAALIVTGSGFAAARAAGRVALVVAGAGVLAVAATPLPAGRPHTSAALVALAALTAWPALGARGRSGRLGRPAAARATVAGVVLLAVLYGAPHPPGGFGVVEKVLSGGELTWLALVVAECRRADERP